MFAGVLVAIVLSFTAGAVVDGQLDGKISNTIVSNGVSDTAKDVKKK
jgi:hypothetical protein